MSVIDVFDVIVVLGPCKNVLNPLIFETEPDFRSSCHIVVSLLYKFRIQVIQHSLQICFRILNFVRDDYFLRYLNIFNFLISVKV